MAGMYDIDWSPPNLLPGLQMIQAARNATRQAKRADEYLEMEKEAVEARAERESAALARQKEQDKFNRDLKAFESMPELQRRARKSPAAASMNPFGIGFEEGQDLPADVEGPEPSPAAEAARFMMNPKGGQPETPELAAPQHERPADALPYGVEGPAQTPEGEAERFAGTDELMDRAQEGVQPLDPMTMAAANSQGTPLEPKKRLFMTFQGQRSEVPEQNESTGLGAKYDAIYQAMLEVASPEHAFNKALADYEKDQAAAASDARLGRTLAQQDKAREDRQEQERLLSLTREDKLAEGDKNRRSRERNAATTAGAGHGPQLQAFIAAANALKPGEPIPPEVGELGRKAGFKINQIATEVDRYRNSDEKSVKGGGSGVLGLKEVAPLNASIDNIDKLISQIEKDPTAWEEYKGNALNWKRGEGFRGTTVGKGFQALGISDVAPEQGLKGEGAKTLHQRQERLNTDIAKSFGGVITEGDRNAAASNQANFALDARQKIAQLREMRDSLIAKRNVFAPGKGGPSGGAGAGVRRLRMPDGTIAEFDASGKRVK